jgi:hypothetical protein
LTLLFKWKSIKTTSTIKIVRNETKSIPENVSYIDGKKVNKEEVDKLDPSIIEKWMSLKRKRIKY